ncbi:MAG: hypothetical protein ACRD0P_39990, partial [Stackebrandtia sp.]
AGASAGPNRTDSSPPGNNRPSSGRPTGKEEPRKEPIRPKPTESAAQRLARELSERHNVRTFGFELPGIDIDALTEIVAAVDDLLPRYPVAALSEIGIAEFAGDGPVHAEWDVVQECSRLVIASHAISGGAAQLRRIFDAGVGALPYGFTDRPVYAAVGRAFATILDAAGGYTASRRAHRVLLEAYLPLREGETGSARSTVSGFRAWRARLGDSSFSAGVFDPTAAVAAAFVDVVVNTANATPPARVLHNLLVNTAAGGSTEPRV